VNATLAAGLGDENWWVRRNSAAALASLPGGDETLVAALESGDRFAGDAAAEALADSGALAEARDRVESGRGTASDHTLLGYVTAQEEVPA
jgi:hypothetical protein